MKKWKKESDVTKMLTQVMADFTSPHKKSN